MAVILCDLLLYGDLQRELIDEGDPVVREATVAELVQLLTAAVLIWAAGVDIDPLVLWARISQELVATEGVQPVSCSASGSG